MRRLLGTLVIAVLFAGNGLAWAGQVASMVEVFRGGETRQRHPTHWNGVLKVPSDVDTGGHFEFDYWRDGNTGTNRGTILYTVEIRRDTDADGIVDSTEQHDIAGSRDDGAVSVTLGPLSELREGDEIVVLARFRRMPGFRSRDRATLELSLLDSERRCPEVPRPLGDISPPRKISSPNPQYTEEARKARIQGTVIIQSTLECDGHPRNIRILKGLPFGLDSEAIEALSQWRLEPARSGRIPITVFYNLTVNFRLQSVLGARGPQMVPSVTVEGRVTGVLEPPRPRQKR